MCAIMFITTNLFVYLFQALKAKIHKHILGIKYPAFT